VECVSFPAFNVVGYEFDNSVGNVCLVYFAYEIVYVDSVKGFAEVEGNYNGALGWLRLIETLGDLVC